MEYELLIDRETGECVDLPEIELESSRVPDVPVSNAETGEPEINVSPKSQRRRVPFQIPKEIKDELSLKKDKKEKKSNRKYAHHKLDILPLSKGTCFGQMNPIFLFLPAIFYCKWFAATLILFEVIFHRWAHHKNKSLKDYNVYYRSPLNGITSEFCALCQDETRMNRVGKMHQIRLHKFFRQCHYMKRAVS
ncbi:hypothetical protein PV325_004066 [Microctonus aethiopoides]|uniref:Uncharacterized protein n=1 Tax=Microctonus aethiopoides TaxID=144406 RepID=A0AA39FWZ5_9HYME|nr:hypothetical protein PV325_004066 [Microctonus aethiopoides]KAK0093466.1 hypothetical protein PV326_013454 [Microctonus aethiopoides]KAK0177258.1 hypothetical protein PV328_001330 [Microctonus aethiopoides]